MRVLWGTSRMFEANATNSLFLPTDALDGLLKEIRVHVNLM